MVSDYCVDWSDFESREVIEGTIKVQTHGNEILEKLLHLFDFADGDGAIDVIPSFYSEGFDQDLL